MDFNEKRPTLHRSLTRFIHIGKRDGLYSHTVHPQGKHEKHHRTYYMLKRFR